MNQWFQHFPILPVAVPLLAGAAMLMLRDARRRTRLALGFASLVAQLAIAIVLLCLTAGFIPSNWPGGVGVYLLGDWPAPFGIVAVVPTTKTP